MFVIALRKCMPLLKDQIYQVIREIFSTNKRVYRKLYTILYKSSRKFCFKMPCSIRSRVGLEVLLNRICG